MRIIEVDDPVKIILAKQEVEQKLMDEKVVQVIPNPNAPYQQYTIKYLSANYKKKIEEGRWAERGFREDGSKIIVEVGGKKVGVYRNEEGKSYVVKPYCTHLGCELSWNNLDKTWDCPCHGSRFTFEGKSIYDPSMKDLERFNI